MNIVTHAVAQERARGWLAAVDPAVDHPAAAVFDRGMLVIASRVKLPGALKELDEGERARQIADLIASFILTYTRGARPSLLVYEKPQIYRREKSKGDPNDLIKLALVCGGVANALAVPVYGPTPFEWIGNIPKTDANGKLYKNPWDSPRGKLIAGRLGPLACTVVVPSHDAVDAAGLGAHALGLLGRTYGG